MATLKNIHIAHPCAVRPATPPPNIRLFAFFLLLTNGLLSLLFDIAYIKQ